MANSDEIAELDRGRRLARRYMGWGSFGFLMTSGILIVGKLLFMQDPTLFATALVTAQPVLASLFGVFTVITVGYLGFSAMENTFKR